MGSNVRYIIEKLIDISAEEIGKLGLPVSGASPHCFSEKEYFGQLHLKRYIFISNQI